MPGSGRGSPAGASSDYDELIGKGTQGLNKTMTASGEVMNWNQMHDNYRESVLDDWRKKKGSSRPREIQLVKMLAQDMAAARNKERETRKQRLEDRKEREDADREKKARANKELSAGWSAERDELERARLSGIKQQREFFRYQRQKAAQRLEEEQTAETLRARERREREQDMLKRELMSSRDQLNTQWRSEHEEQEASRQRKQQHQDEVSKQRLAEAQRERQARQHREQLSQKHRAALLNGRREEIKTAYQKRAQELERAKEDKVTKTAARLKAWKDQFHCEAEMIIQARNQRAEQIEIQVKQRQQYKMEQRQWAREQKYIVSPGRGGSASPNTAMGHAPAPSTHHGIH